MNLFEVAAALTLNTKAYKKGLDDAKRETKGFASSVSGSVGGASESAAKLGQSFVSASRNGSSSVGILQKSVHALGSGVKAVVDGLLKIGEIGVKAFGAVSVAAVGVVKQAVSSYAEYEQLAGGIQKLYGEGAETVLKNAEKAYATAGMSANEYLQNATSFSAMLVNSLAGDEKKAAELTDTAMRDIADNANTFGKYSANELAAVYQSLARGQYQMLDNLQIGFGGSKTEAQRLIKTANELKRSMGQAGDLTLDKFSDVVEAIHLVQENMNISGLSAEEAAEAVASGLMTEEQAYQAMGTTAKEATKTISGSLTMTKKAVQDFVAGLANPNADIERLVNNVVTSAGYAAENLIPTIERAVSGLSTSLEKLAPRTEKIAEQFGGMAIDVATSIAGAMPSLIDAGSKLIIGLLNGIDKNRTKITDAGVKAVTSIASAISKNAPKILSTATQLISAFIRGISQNLPSLAASARELVSTLASDIGKNLPTLLQTGKEIILTLLKEISSSDSLVEILNAGTEIVLSLAEAILAPDTISVLVDTGINLMTELALGLGNSLDKISEKAPEIIDSLGKGLSSNIPKIESAVIELVGSFVEYFVNHIASEESIKGWIEAGKFIYTTIASAFLGEDVNEIFESLKTNIENGDWESVGETIFGKMIKGIIRVNPAGMIISSIFDWKSSRDENGDAARSEYVERYLPGAQTGSSGKGFGSLVSSFANDLQSHNQTIAQAAENAAQESTSKMGTVFGEFFSAAKSDAETQGAEAGEKYVSGFKSAFSGDKADGLFGGTTADGQPLELTGIKVDAEDLAAAMGNVIVKTASDETVTSLNDTITTINDSLGKYFPELSTGITTGNDNLTSVIGLMQQYLPYIPQLAALKVVLDSGALVGALTPMVNAALGAQLGVEQRGGA